MALLGVQQTTENEWHSATSSKYWWKNCWSQFWETLLYVQMSDWTNYQWERRMVLTDIWAVSKCVTGLPGQPVNLVSSLIIAQEKFVQTAGGGERAGGQVGFLPDRFSTAGVYLLDWWSWGWNTGGDLGRWRRRGNFTERLNTRKFS